MIIKEPLKIDYENESTEEIINKIAHSIEQHQKFLKVIPQNELNNDSFTHEKWLHMFIMRDRWRER